MTEFFNLRAGITEGRYSLRALNSLTKYPEIPTYHPLGEKGRLREAGAVKFHGTVDLTEKIDGTNTRIITLPDGTVIVGSREELLYGRGDLVPNAQLGIVDTVLKLELLDRAVNVLTGSNVITVYGETYGAGVGKAGRRYAGGTDRTGFRVFDVSYAPVDMLLWDPEQLARWRQAGEQKWFSAPGVHSVIRDLDSEYVPFLGAIPADTLPQTLTETREWLERRVGHSGAKLFSGERIAAEGIVLRGYDETGKRRLAKARFEDYDRTLRVTA